MVNHNSGRTSVFGGCYGFTRCCHKQFAFALLAVNVFIVGASWITQTDDMAKFGGLDFWPVRPLKVCEWR